jgi:hypothetical protein
MRTALSTGRIRADTSLDAMNIMTTRKSTDAVRVRPTRGLGSGEPVPRVHALLAAIVNSRVQPDGFSTRTLRDHLAPNDPARDKERPEVVVPLVAEGGLILMAELTGSGPLLVASETL